MSRNPTTWPDFNVDFQFQDSCQTVHAHVLQFRRSRRFRDAGTADGSSSEQIHSDAMLEDVEMFKQPWRQACRAGVVQSKAAYL
ncbi:hypothetical protein BKA80DRAFT_259903 [Phyllosticta citrichinensis]